MVPARIDALPYAIYVINQAVPRIQRREIFNIVKKSFAEYFDGKDIQKECEEMCRRADWLADSIENKFLELNVDEDALPMFDFDINLND